MTKKILRFKEGDNVICMDNTGILNLTVGKFYKVISLRNHGTAYTNKNYIEIRSSYSIVIERDNGQIDGLCPKRFRSISGICSKCTNMCKLDKKSCGLYEE